MIIQLKVKFAPGSTNSLQNIQIFNIKLHTTGNCTDVLHTVDTEGLRCTKYSVMQMQYGTSK